MVKTRHLSTLLIALTAVTLVSSVRGQQADNEVTRLLERMVVHAPHHYGGLTLFPLELRGGEDGTDYASLDEAIRGGYLLVQDSGVVRQVTMQNTSAHRWVFAMSGEVILGGKQNRMLREDVLLPPGSGPITVPTYCVEQGRWVGHAKAKFGSGGALGNYALRRKAIAGASQKEVWGQVDAEQRRFRVASPTQDYDRVANSPAVQRALGEYRSAYVRIWRPRMVGFVVAQGNRIVAADAFANPSLFLKLRRKLIDSYSFDCIRRYERFRPTLRQQDARDFVARIYTARFGQKATPGSGRALAFQGSGIEGTSLSRRGVVTHLHATPGYHVVPVPRPPLPIRPLPEPRDR